MNNSRQERGRVLARDRRTRNLDGGIWFVPSLNQPGAGYLVNAETGACSCLDAQRGVKCKHVFAVEYRRSGEVKPDEAPRGTELAKALPGKGPRDEPRRGHPGDLLPEEQAHVRLALRYLRRRYGWDSLARALRSTSKSLKHSAYKSCPPSARLALRIARFAGVSVDDVLAGRYPPAGTCPRCGYLAESGDPEGAAP